MLSISANTNTNFEQSLFTSFYECSQPIKFFCAQISGQIQLVHSLLLSFREYLYNIKGGW